MELYGRNVRKTCLSILLVVVCFMTSFSFFNINAHADNVIRTGTVVGVTDGLNFRSGPGTEYPAIDWLKNGDTGKILDEKKATTGKIWYQMNVNNVVGWASSTYIKVTETVLKEDADFNEYLTAQGFPDSYKAQLQALHAMYPSWKFEAQITNLKWDDVIAAESEVGVNTVHDSSSPSSWNLLQPEHTTGLPASGLKSIREAGFPLLRKLLNTIWIRETSWIVRMYSSS